MRPCLQPPSIHCLPICPGCNALCTLVERSCPLCLTRRDLKRTKPQSAIFFNALFNLHKFLSFENRDPFAARAEAGEYAGLTDWDKFAKVEYFR